MKSHHKYRFWLVSLVVHLCLATVFSFIIINQTTLSDVDGLEVSILKVKPVPPVKKPPRIEAPPIAPTPTPNFQIERQSVLAQTGLYNPSGEINFCICAENCGGGCPQFLSLGHSLRATQIAVQGASHANDPPAQSLTTAVDLPLQSDAPLAAGPERR